MITMTLRSHDNKESDIKDDDDVDVKPDEHTLYGVVILIAISMIR